MGIRSRVSIFTEEYDEDDGWHNTTQKDTEKDYELHLEDLLQTFREVLAGVGFVIDDKDLILESPSQNSILPEDDIEGGSV